MYYIVRCMACWSLQALTLWFLLKQAETFDCNFAPRPATPPDESVAPLISATDPIKPALEIIFSHIPGAAIGIFIIDKWLSKGTSAPSVWEQVQDKVERLIHAKIDDSRLADLCSNLQEFRSRLELCDLDEDVAKTACLKNLLDYMIGREPHFQGKHGRDIALTLGTYTQYTVMTLAVGKMLINQQEKFPLKGTAILRRIKPAAMKFDAYVNASIEKAIDWRKMEIGHYIKRRRNFVFWSNDGEGVIGVNRKRSIAMQHDYKLPSTKNLTSSSNLRSPAITSNKRGPGASPSTYHKGKLTVTDKVLGKVIFEKEDAQRNYNKVFDDLFDEAKRVVDNARKKQEDEMRQIYKEQVLPITNQYWRIYLSNDFGDPEKEDENRAWLDEL